MPVFTEQRFDWLPSSRDCGCEQGRLNCLDRRETYELGSTVLNIQKRQVWKDSHPARFIPELPEKYIKLFSHRGETVLDPFCGSGTTNVVASTLGRNSIGIDVNPYSAEMTVNRLRGSEASNGTRHHVITGDCRKVMELIPEDSIDLTVTSPPYFDVVDYNHQDRGQLGNLHDYGDFLTAMGEALNEVLRVLKPGGHLVVNTQDLFKRDSKCPIHSDYIQMSRDMGYEILNVNIYILNYSTGGRLVFGFPKSYYPKNDHEYVIILRKPSRPKDHVDY